MTLEEALGNDKFAKVVGARILEAANGSAIAELELTEDHLNGLGLVHGGVIFSLADMAFAAASNSHGVKAVAINLTINFIKSAQEGKPTAHAREISLSRKIGNYHIDVTDENGVLIASLMGMVYRMSSN